VFIEEAGQDFVVLLLGFACEEHEWLTLFPSESSSFRVAARPSNGPCLKGSAATRPGCIAVTAGKRDLSFEAEICDFCRDRRPSSLLRLGEQARGPD
jgi:hypothetical protein